MAIKYTNIQHDFRKMHDISLLEYVICDMVWMYSNFSRSKVKDWCTETRQDLADEIGITKKTLITLVERMIEKGFLEKADSTKSLRTTNKWETVYTIRTNGVKITPEIITPKVNGLHQNNGQDGVKTSPDTIISNNTHSNNNIADAGNSVPYDENFSFDNLEGIKDEKTKGKKKKAEGAAPEFAYKECMDVYNSFSLRVLDVPAKIDGMQGKALKSIIAFMVKVVNDKKAEKKDITPVTVDEVTNAFTYLLSPESFAKWDPFHQKQIKLNQINGNLPNLIGAIKGVGNNNKSRMTIQDQQKLNAILGR